MLKPRHRRTLDTTLWIAGAALSAALFTDAAHARDRFDLANPSYVAECGSCHVPYPPQLLPAASWKAVIAGLDKHFGTDAALDAKTTATIANYLVVNAGPVGKFGDGSLSRITATPWFQREHRKVPAAAWKREPVKTAANCAACHAGAADGNYDEHAARIPPAVR
ncbi:MAG: diheme cytochrome c [Burkholderiales bacterium]|jgi:cytochrome c553|nr:diheme cytochrome c [Burkholderiales bacterium]